MKIRLENSTTACVIFFMQANYIIDISAYSYTKFGDVFMSLSLLLGMFFLMLHYIVIVRSKFTYQNFILTLAVLSIAVFAYINTGGGTMVKMLIFAASFKEVDLRKVLRYYYNSNIALILFLMASALCGVIEHIHVSKLNDIGYALGFLNPNGAGMCISITAVLGLYLNYDKVGFIWWAGIATAFFLNMVTLSRSAVFALVILVILVFLEKKKSLYRNGLVKLFAPNAFLLCGGISYLAARNFGQGRMWQTINELLSWRPYLYNQYYINFPIKLFGNFFLLEENGALDNAYLLFLFRYGVVVFFLYHIMFFACVKYAYQKKDFACVVIAIFYAGYFLMESGPSTINMNFTLIYFWTMFWRGTLNEKRCTEQNIAEGQHNHANLQL